MARIKPNTRPISPPTETQLNPIEIISDTRDVMRDCAVWIIDGLIGLHKYQLTELEQQRAGVVARERGQQ